MKRHKALSFLTDEHHHALVLCLRLKKATTDDVSQAVAMLDKVWQTQILPHFRFEEDVLLPEIAQASSIQHPEIIRTCTDHVALRALVRRIGQAPSDEKLKLFVEFADRLEEHIRYEERTLFCLVESLLGEEELLRVKSERKL